MRSRTFISRNKMNSLKYCVSTLNTITGMFPENIQDTRMLHKCHHLIPDLRHTGPCNTGTTADVTLTAADGGMSRGTSIVSAPTCKHFKTWTSEMEKLSVQGRRSILKKVYSVPPNRTIIKFNYKHPRQSHLAPAFFQRWRRVEHSQHRVQVPRVRAGLVVAFLHHQVALDIGRMVQQTQLIPEDLLPAARCDCSRTNLTNLIELLDRVACYLVTS